MTTVIQDLRYGVRMLAKSSGFTLVAVITLALGIGANAAIFSAISPILIEPLPYPHSSRIMIIWNVFQGGRSQLAFHSFREMEARNRSFDALAILEPWQATMSRSAELERLNGQQVSAGYFRVLGVSPTLGRDFQPSDDGFPGPKVAILGYGLWQRRFGGDGAVVGRPITLDGDAYTVVGIMPRGFENVLAPATEIWSPTQYDPSHPGDPTTSEWGNRLRLIGRRRAGVSLEQAGLISTGLRARQWQSFPACAGPRQANFARGWASR